MGTPHIFSEQGVNGGGGTPHILSEWGANRGGHRTSKQVLNQYIKALGAIIISTWGGLWGPPPIGKRVKVPTPSQHHSGNMQRLTRLLPDNLQTTQRLYLVATQYLDMLAPGGWVGRGVYVLGGHHLHNHTTSWLHLASWNLPDSQLSWESKMEPECGNSSLSNTEQ